MENEELIEELGQLRDKCDNYLAATALRVPPEIHVEGLTGGMKEVRDWLDGILSRLGRGEELPD